MSTQLLYTVTYIYTAGFEVVDTEIGRENIPERIYTRPWSTCMYIYCPEGKTKGVNDQTIFIFIIKLHPSS